MYREVTSYGTVDESSSGKFKYILNRVNKTASMNCFRVCAPVPIVGNCGVVDILDKLNSRKHIESLTQLIESSSSNNDQSHPEILLEMNNFLTYLQVVFLFILFFFTLLMVRAFRYIFFKNIYNLLCNIQKLITI